jgi:hypothetical protein
MENKIDFVDDHGAHFFAIPINALFLLWYPCMDATGKCERKIHYEIQIMGYPPIQVSYFEFCRVMNAKGYSNEVIETITIPPPPESQERVQ